MKIYNYFLAFSLNTAVIIPSAVQAAPTATVTIKNLSTGTVYNTVQSLEEIDTYAAANPKPATSISSSGTNSFQVNPKPAGPFYLLVLKYQATTPPATGGKECFFTSGYISEPIFGGMTGPEWGKETEGSGGAICTATITSTDPITGNWSVEFTMQ
ncbi:hypothetical protein DUD43_13785 [Alcaligenes faecalis]|uniref:hypothetical protein n=1 Tax=Alcaligenes faecalis TaxID=511 RepID=UPI001293D1BC|nr:hypothetical protein [Alcaligenes faecalis]QFY78684.1 hypothetical protein DUD43_13785 [Alcaligenes faecalis]